MHTMPKQTHIQSPAHTNTHMHATPNTQQSDKQIRIHTTPTQIKSQTHNNHTDKYTYTKRPHKQTHTQTNVNHQLNEKS